MLDQTSERSSLIESLLLDTRQADTQPRKEGGSDFSFDPACLLAVAQEIIFYFHQRCQGTITQPHDTHCGRLSILVDQIKLLLLDSQSRGQTVIGQADRKQIPLPNCRASSWDRLYTLLVDAVSEISNDYQRGYTIQQAENQSYVQQAKNLSSGGKRWLLAYRLTDNTFLVYGIRSSFVSDLTNRLESLLQLD